MGDRIDDLMAAVDLLRQQVQEQANIIEGQQHKISRIGYKIAHLPTFESSSETSIGALKFSMELAENDIIEIQERLWPGRRAEKIAEIRARRQTNKARF